MSKKKPSLRPAANDAEPTPKVIIPPPPRAGLFRRLGAWALDLPLVGILLGAAAFLGYGLALVLEAMGRLELDEHPDVQQWLAHNTLYILFLTCVVCGFYLWFWCKRGQTPGMRVLRLRVQNTDGSHLKVGQALVRMFSSAFGLGNLLVIFDINQLAFQDHWGDCEVILLDPEDMQ
jgi:uncharacterized RDD family membrane protein YckC